MRTIQAFLTLALIACTLVSCTGAPVVVGTGTPLAAAETLAEPETTPATVTAEGKLLPAPAVELTFTQGGVIANVPVSAGDRVKEGEVIARLVGFETVQAELAAAQLERTLAQQALDTLRREAMFSSAETEKALIEAQKAYESAASSQRLGNTQDASQLELKLDDYIETEEDYTEAKERLDDLLDEDEGNRERQDAQADLDSETQDLAKSYADLQVALAENDHPLKQDQAKALSAIGALEVARELQSRLDGDNLDPELLAAAEARLSAATTSAAAAEAAVELYELRAPFAGVILSMINLKPGQAAIPGTSMAYLAGADAWTVETTDLAEVDIARVALEQTATVKLDALPGESFPAVVTAIDPVGRLHLGEMTYQVTITLVEPDPRFMWNMTATVTIEAGK